MNRAEKIKEIKTLVRELQNSEQVLGQSLAVITSRKEKLQQELLDMGIHSSASRGSVLSEKQSIEIIGSLTK
jgi:hypothetical protein